LPAVSEALRIFRIKCILTLHNMLIMFARRGALLRAAVALTLKGAMGGAPQVLLQDDTTTCAE
jgi:hypothetical protein